MPNEIRVIELNYYRNHAADFQVSEELEGYIAFAFPGRFVGVGETREEAMTMAKMRLRASRKSHLNSGKTENDWIKWAMDRGAKILDLYNKMGLKKSHVWEEDDLEKK